MNDNTIRYPLPPGERLDEVVRANPTNALLLAAGLGFGLALFLKGGHSQSSTKRMQSILDDFEDSLRSAVQPAARHASSLAESGGRFFEDTRGEMTSALCRAIREGRKNWKRLFR